MNQQECRERHEELVDAVVGQAVEEVDGTDLPEFTPAERERLMRLQRAVRRGVRSDAYPVDRRQDFVRWLIDHGKLSDN